VPSVQPQGLTDLKVKQIVRLRGEAGRESTGVVLNPEPGVPTQPKGDPADRVKEALAGTVMEVLERRLVQSDGETWVKFRVCQSEGDSAKLVKPGDQGWHAEKTILSELELQDAVVCNPQGNSTPSNVPGSASTLTPSASIPTAPGEQKTPASIDPAKERR
jgi:hypothetical protein